MTKTTATLLGMIMTALSAGMGAPLAKADPLVGSLAVFYGQSINEDFVGGPLAFVFQGNRIHPLACSEPLPAASTAAQAQQYLSEKCISLDAESTEVMGGITKYAFQQAANRFILSSHSYEKGHNTAELSVLSSSILTYTLPMNDLSTISIDAAYLIHSGTENPRLASFHVNLLKVGEHFVDYPLITTVPLILK
jgi:hypothetical protein